MPALLQQHPDSRTGNHDDAGTTILTSQWRRKLRRCHLKGVLCYFPGVKGLFKGNLNLSGGYAHTPATPPSSAPAPRSPHTEARHPRLRGASEGVKTHIQEILIDVF